MICHVCVDIVTAASRVKYISKYVTKGADMAKARISGILSEIEQYRTTRYISAAEANSRLGSAMLNRTQAITLIYARLEGEKNVMYLINATLQERLDSANASASMLKIYFERPENVFFLPLQSLLLRILHHPKKEKDCPIYTHAPHGKWLDKYGNVSRRTSENTHACRIGFQSPAIGDLFYLRLLLHNSPARYFTELRTIDDPRHGPTEHPTFRSAATARGLVSGDEEYSICM